MKIPTLLKRKKLRAATARRSVGAPAEIDYEEMAEPSMKLSRALLIVLLLHVVAVAGIIAFNALKTRQSTLSSSPSTNTVAVAPPETKPQTTAANSTAPVKTNPKTQAKVSDSGKTYVVAK